MATTVTLNSTSKYLRKTATHDMPEFNLVKGQIYYQVRSSANDNSYYIVSWSYQQIKWTCSCDGFFHRHNCKHCKTASEASHKYSQRPKARRSALNPELVVAVQAELKITASTVKAGLVNGKLTLVGVPIEVQPSAEFLKHQQALEKGVQVLSSVFVETLAA